VILSWSDWTSLHGVPVSDPRQTDE
jgi:hypothetical protein